MTKVVQSVRTGELCVRLESHVRETALRDGRHTVEGTGGIQLRVKHLVRVTVGKLKRKYSARIARVERRNTFSLFYCLCTM